MKVLMLSLDKTLLGEQTRDDFGVQGDTISRHIKYASYVSELNVVVTSPPGYTHTKLSKNLHVYPTCSRTLIGHFLSILKYAESFYSHMSLDLVVAQDLLSPAAYLISKKYNVPYIVNFHSAGFDSPEWRKGFLPFLLPLVKYAVKSADRVRVVSKTVKKNLSHYKVKGIEVIPTPVDLELFANFSDKEAVRIIRSKYDAEYIVLTDGRLEEVKDISTLFMAFKELLIHCRKENKSKAERVRLLIIGTGSLKDRLIKESENLGISRYVVFIGSVDFDRLPLYYHACDVFVLTSKSESLGKVILQASASGKVVIATKTEGAKSIIKNNKTGFLVDIGKPRQIVSKIKKVLEDERLRREMGENAREYVLNNFSAEKNTVRIIDMWEEVVNDRKFV